MVVSALGQGFQWLHRPWKSAPNGYVLCRGVAPPLDAKIQHGQELRLPASGLHDGLPGGRVRPNTAAGRAKEAAPAKLLTQLS
eukprot:169779-Chlamydomonas_euryale.AAC.4